MIARIKRGAISYIKDLSLLSTNARLFLLGAFFIGLTFSAFSLLLNLYLRERGFGEAFIGRVLSFGAIGISIVSIPGAILISRVRLKPILLMSTVLYAVFGLLTIYAGRDYFILGAYFCAGMMMAFYRIASAPFFMRNSTPRERPYLFSLSFGIAVMAGVIGSFVFGQLVDIIGDRFAVDSAGAHRLSLTIGILLSLLALIPFGLLRMPPGIPKSERLVLSRQTLSPLRGILFRLTIPYVLVGLGAGMIIPFLNIFFRDRFGQSPEEIGYYFGILNLTMFVGVMVGPILVRKIGMVRTMIYTQLASIPFMLILAFCYYFPFVVGAFLIRGTLMNMGHPIGNNFAMEMVPRSHHAIVNALLMFAWTFSWMISTQLGGWLIEQYGYTQSLLIPAGLYVLSSVLYYRYFKKAEQFTPEGFIIRPEFKIAEL